MELTGQQIIALPQDETWRALNDPELLKECIPGCESFERISATQYQTTLTARIGPVSAKFKGLMTLAEVDPPRGYTLVFEGQGGIAGFAKGEAVVALAPEGESTLLSYTAKAMVGGKIAQLGARLIDGVARKLANDFFTAFNNRASNREQPDKP